MIVRDSKVLEQFDTSAAINGVIVVMRRIELAKAETSWEAI